MAYLRIRRFTKERTTSVVFTVKFNNNMWHVIDDKSREVVRAFRTEREALVYAKAPI